MNYTKILPLECRLVLQKARQTYGETKQILVSTEELCELATVCTKYPRYDTPDKAKTELHSKAVDEVADVLIVLDHIINIFELSSEEIDERISAKVDRVIRWLSASNSMEQTTIDRTVIEHKDSVSGSCAQSANLPCSSCKYMGDYRNLAPGRVCCTCVQEEGSRYSPKETQGEICS